MKTLVTPQRIGHTQKLIKWFVFEDNSFYGKCIINNEEKILSEKEIKASYECFNEKHHLSLPKILSTNKDDIKKDYYKQKDDTLDKTEAYSSVEENIIEESNKNYYRKTIYVITDSIGNFSMDVDGSYKKAKDVAISFLPKIKNLVLEKRIIESSEGKVSSSDIVDSYYIIEAFDKNGNEVFSMDIDSKQDMNKKEEKIKTDHPFWEIKTYRVLERIEMKEEIETHQ